MIPILSVEELGSRIPPDSLPFSSDGETLAEARIDLALREATGIIVTHLPWLLDEETGEVTLPLPAQFADTLYGICVDLALYRLHDTVSSSEDEREHYKSNLKLLETIDREHQGGLAGPDYQDASIVEPSEEENIPDTRYWKKGELI
ncbi:phage protein Gp36 family protein [Sediminispirochaeta bajacaliforniensis]|uniref:phage protein Gp36 family protein n=1 Tax=Sediminispirochaeta bajacaliforniensis TaxID=148 RepID=UPI00036D7176|nr:phage protein Gp36 family protein [Sediminispirochaeta bajacaliforniensis]